MNEAQTRFNKIDPKLRDAGWGIVPEAAVSGALLHCPAGPRHRHRSQSEANVTGTSPLSHPEAQTRFNKTDKEMN